MLMELAHPKPMLARQLAGRVAVVTGSTSGIGLGIARAFAAAGAAIVLNGLGKTDEVGRVASELSDEFGLRVIYSPADMSDPSLIEAMIAPTGWRV
jgi:3-hydroxybutyrate dehydrogenase